MREENTDLQLEILLKQTNKPAKPPHLCYYVSVNYLEYSLSHFGKIQACLENLSLFWALSSPYIHKYFILLPTLNHWGHSCRNLDCKGTQAPLFSVIWFGFFSYT